jgi:hypothetical protein
MDDLNQEPGGIDVNSIVSAATGQPFVQFSASQLQWQMTPSEARAWAQVIVEAAEAADQDAFLMDWLVTRIEVERGHAAQILLEYREFRERKRGREPESI